MIEDPVASSEGIRIATHHAVEFASAAGVIETLEGPVSYQPGDAIVTGVSGERWPVSAAEFARRYERVANGEGPGRYRRRPQRVQVSQVLTRDAAVATAANGDAMHGEAGDFRVTDGEGSRIVARDVFARTYVWNRDRERAPFDPVSRYERFERDLTDSETSGSGLDRSTRWLGAVHDGFNRLIASAPARLVAMLSLPVHHVIGPLAPESAQHEGAGVRHSPTAHGAGVAAEPGPDVAAARSPLGAAVERLAMRHSRLHRGAIVSVHLLGALAVTLAVLPHAWPTLGQGAIVWGVGALEAMALLAVMALYRSALRWRTRWLDYRALAEGLRYASLGARIEPAPGDAWWQVVLHSRAPSSAAPSVDAQRLLESIREQGDYHRRTAHELGERHEQGHRLTLALFGFSVLGCLAHLVFHWSGLLLLTAALPAFSAALHGVLGALELDTLANHSRRVAQALGELERRTAALAAAKATDDAAARGRDELAALTGEFLQLVSLEVREWHGGRLRKPPPLP